MTSLTRAREAKKLDIKYMKGILTKIVNETAGGDLTKQRQLLFITDSVDTSKSLASHIESKLRDAEVPHKIVGERCIDVHLKGFHLVRFMEKSRANSKLYGGAIPSKTELYRNEW